MKSSRRNFLKNTGLAGAGMVFNSGINENLNKPEFGLNKDFTLTICATNWGFSGDVNSFCKKSKDEGYDGVEIWAPFEKKAQDDFFNAIEKNDLKFGFLAGSWGKNFQEHFDNFQKAIENAITLKPLFINCHSGKDFFTFEQSKRIFDYSIKQSKEAGIPILHETHRGRILFAAHTSKEFLEKLPELRLTLDISHWCVVAESLLQNQKEVVQMALNRTDHIHSRVGFEEGPQVPEPRAPEFKKAVDAHFDWWDQVVKLKSDAGKHLTMTTEFGPPNYMWSLPYTKQPLANLWDVNASMMRMWKERYQ